MVESHDRWQGRKTQIDQTRSILRTAQTNTAPSIASPVTKLLRRISFQGGPEATSITRRRETATSRVRRFDGANGSEDPFSVLDPDNRSEDTENRSPPFTGVTRA
jgi:hypothetical protein